MFSLIILLLTSPQSQAQYAIYTNAMSYCTSFIAKATPEAKAVYLFTAGHCVPSVKVYDNLNNLVIKKELAKPKDVVLYDIATSLQLTQIYFGSYNTADFAIFKMAQTQEELEQLGVKPLILAAKAPVDTAVSIFNPKLIQTQSCQIEDYPHSLIYPTVSYTPTWILAGRLSASCALKPGWSGAPVVNVSTGEVQGLISGGNNTGDCTDYCELDEKGNQQALLGRTYFTRLDFLKKCLESDGSVIPETCWPPSR